MMVLDPGHFGDDALPRLTSHLARLAAEHGVYVPGRDALLGDLPAEVEIDDDVWEQLNSRL